jgi:hypothetical protein
MRGEVTMKLCGQISVEVNVDDFVEAADHQRRLEEILQLVRKSYPEAALAMRERRDRKPMSLAPAPRPPSGTLNRYEDG